MHQVQPMLNLAGGPAALAKLRARKRRFRRAKRQFHPTDCKGNIQTYALPQTSGSHACFSTPGQPPLLPAKTGAKPMRKTRAKKNGTVTWVEKALIQHDLLPARVRDSRGNMVPNNTPRAEEGGGYCRSAQLMLRARWILFQNLFHAGSRAAATPGRRKNKEHCQHC